MFKFITQRGIFFWFWFALITTTVGGGAVIFGAVACAQDKCDFGGGLPDMVISITATPESVAAGEEITYRLRFTNDGEREGTAVTLTNPLPPGVSVVTLNSACQESGGTVTCLLGTRQPGSGGTVVIVVKVDPSATGAITNTASITAEEEEQSTKGDNTASVTTAIN